MNHWGAEINGIHYDIVFTPHPWSGKHELTINGYPVELQRPTFGSLRGIDQTIMLGGIECHFVLIGNKADFAVGGTYIDSQKPYMPLKSTPWWAYIFMVACIALPVSTLGGALPVVLGILGFTGCLRISINPTRKTAASVFACLGLTLLVWAVGWAFVYLLSTL